MWEAQAEAGALALEVDIKTSTYHKTKPVFGNVSFL